MTGKDLYDAIHQCEDIYIEKTAELIENYKPKHKHIPVFRNMAAVLLCIIVLGISVTVFATASDAFREWLFDVFAGYEVTEPDIAADANHRLSLKDNMCILSGDSASIVCQTHQAEDETVLVDKAYAIVDDGLKELAISSFQGDYDGEAFSFTYTIVNQEIFLLNSEGAMDQLFSYVEGNLVYAMLASEGEEHTIAKECLVQMNLETGSITKISDDTMTGNTILSPGGKVVLCNYRAEEYWTVFDIESRTETRVEAIPAYSHTKEIRFLDDDTILTLGESMIKDGTEQWETYKIDLRTGQITERYPGYGEIQVAWNYLVENNTLTLHNIVSGDTFTIENVTESLHSIAASGDYVLFGDREEEGYPYYIVNLVNQTFMKVDISKEMYFDVEMYLAGREDKILLANDTEAYLVDVGDMQSGRKK